MHLIVISFKVSIYIYINDDNTELINPKVSKNRQVIYGESSNIFSAVFPETGVDDGSDYEIPGLIVAESKTAYALDQDTRSFGDGLLDSKPDGHELSIAPSLQAQLPTTEATVPLIRNYMPLYP